MKIMVVGGTGTIGSAVVNLLSMDHEVLRVGHRDGDFRMDILSKPSIEALFKSLSPLDALIAVTGSVKFGSLDSLTDEDFELGLRSKLMGQVNLVRLGRKYLNDGGSFTLTSGILAREPMPGSVSVSLVNAALEGFVRAAALEMERGQRINIVSPIFVKETMEAMKMDSAKGMAAAKVALSYKASVEGTFNGRILDVRDFARPV
jgi:NAD(P)-dependent dehydrogenase (short-subunit alcohol dehydrogenase family)